MMSEYIQLMDDVKLQRDLDKAFEPVKKYVCSRCFDSCDVKELKSVCCKATAIMFSEFENWKINEIINLRKKVEELQQEICIMEEQFERYKQSLEIEHYGIE